MYTMTYIYIMVLEHKTKYHRQKIHSNLSNNIHYTYLVDNVGFEWELHSVCDFVFVWIF